MSKITTRSELVFKVTVTLNEGEVRALDAMVGYGIEPFLKVFYEKLGRHYMQPYEANLRELFKRIKSDVCPEIHHIDEVRKKLERS